MQQTRHNTAQAGEEGFMLVGAVVLVFLVLLSLSIAAPKVARALRRDREVEALHRGDEYVRAIQLFYRKTGHYPGNMEQLEKSNNIRYLRQKYPDPMTGKADWRLIHQGEAKTTVKGFFGQPLAGLPGSAGGLGSASSMVSSNQGTASTVGGSASTPMGSSLGSASSSGGFSLGSSSSSTSTPGTTSASATGATVSSASGSSSGVSSQSATNFTGGGGAIVGIGSSKSGESITILNEQKTYETWEFLYDPRIEQLKAKAALLGGAQSTGLGSSSGSGSSFGSSSPSSFGSQPGSTSPLGSSPTTSPTVPPSTNPQ